nr:hypothetical protein [Nostoc sp. DedSLP05]MDZ8103343.1 hypothetical protein [Nostoc sp. DedSLP01]
MYLAICSTFANGICIIGSTGIERQLLLSRNAYEQSLLEESANKLNEAHNSLHN